MKTRRWGLLLASWTLLSVAGACSGDSINNANLLVQDLTTLVGDDILDLDLNSCANLNNSVQNLIGQSACPGGGTVTVSVVNQNCSDGPPLSANLTLNYIVSACVTADENTYNGNLAVQSVLTPSTQNSTLISPSFSGNGEIFSFNNFTLNFAGSFPVCGGNLQTPSGSCGIASDCGSCN